MTEQKCHEVLDFYAGVVEKANKENDPWDYFLEHIRGMIPQMRQMLAEGKREKFMRWLGFIQGVFWRHGTFTVEAMKNHNRPENESGNQEG